MSVPISATITSALRVLTPGMELSSRTAARKGSRSASTSRSVSATAASRAGVDPAQVEPQQEAVVGRDPPTRRFGRPLPGRLDPPMCQGGQHGRTSLAGDRGLGDGAPAYPRDVGRRRAELEVGVLERLPQPLDVAGALADQLLAGSQRGTQRLSGRVGDEAGAHRTMRASDSASQVASATSLSRPGAFFTCAASAGTRVKSPSDSTCRTGFQ